MTNIAKVTEGNLWKDFTSCYSYRQKAQDMCYVAANSYTDQIDSTSLEWGDLRASTQGLWAIFGQGYALGVPNTVVPFGEIWMELDLELCIMMPAQMVTTDPGFQKHETSTHIRCTECKGRTRKTVKKRVVQDGKYSELEDRLSQLEQKRIILEPDTLQVALSPEEEEFYQDQLNQIKQTIPKEPERKKKGTRK